MLVVFEPVQMFQSMLLPDGSERNPMMEFYQRPRQNAMAFQLWVHHCLDYTYGIIAQQVENTDVNLLVFDRCMESTFVFVETLKSRKYLTDLEYTMLIRDLKMVYEKYFNKNMYSCDGIVYLDIPIKDCANRLKRRARPAEMVFPENFENYQHFLSHFYEAHLAAFNLINGSGKVLRLDGSESHDTAIERFFNFAEKIVQDQS
jgi:deoxyadenosine/deoxycytidine kinase